MKASTSDQASADASANSAALRSKKECGAPAYVTMRCATPATSRASLEGGHIDGLMPLSAPPKRPSTGALIRERDIGGSGHPAPGRPDRPAVEPDHPGHPQVGQARQQEGEAAAEAEAHGVEPFDAAASAEDRRPGGDVGLQPGPRAALGVRT